MSTLKSALSELQAFLKNEGDIELAILFGSLSTGQFSEKSDIDIALRKNTPFSEQQKRYFIEQIAKITGRAVDLIDLSVVGEPLLGQIIKHGQRLLGTDTSYAKLALQHIYAQADFAPYISRALKERREQWINS